jgi:hypothetical protein
MIEIEISATGYTTRGPRWQATLDGEIIVASSADPEHDAARALLDRGITGTMAVRHKGAGFTASAWDIEAAAGRRAFDSQFGPSATRKWVPFERMATE